MSVRPLLLPDSASQAGYDHLDPISQWFLGGSGTAGAEATGISDDDRYGLDLVNSGSGGNSFRATSGDGTYQLRVNNSGIALLGGLNVTGTATFYSPVVLNSTLSVTGATTLYSTLSVTGAATFYSTLTVTGATTLRSTLTVTGTGVFSGALTSNSLMVSDSATIGNDLTVSSSLDVTGASTLSSTLSVTGTSTFRSAVTIFSAAGNDQVLSLKYNATAGAFTLGGTNATHPDLVFKDATGAETFRVGDQGSTYQAVVTGDLHVTDEAVVDGNVSGGKVLAGTSAAFGTEELRVVGQSRLEGNVTITTGTFRHENSGNARIECDSTGVGFFGSTPIARPTVTGSRGGNAALADLLSELANLGLVTDLTT